MEDGFEGDKTGGSSPGERCWESELRHWQYRWRGGIGLENKTTDSRVFLDNTKFKLKMSGRERNILENNCYMTEAVA